MTALADAHAAFRTWLFDVALPFWADSGCDRPLLGAHEHLQANGVPALPGFKRVRVQARQLVVFAQAALLGWREGDAAAHGIYRFLVRHAEHGIWARRLTREGEVLDPAADLYDLAFVLLALAWYGRLSGSAAPIARADRLLDWLDRTMAHPAGGYLNTLPVEAGWRQQNPHMHLLEALLALFETSGDARHALRAQRLVALFNERLLDRDSVTLGEFFAEDWSRAPGDAGEQVEPGHHYEWVWLLSEADRLLGSDHSAARTSLYAFCGRHAIDAGTGLVVDELTRAGVIRRGSARLWVQTEALRAHLVMGETAQAERAVGNLIGRYFVHPVAGAWVDQLDPCFAPASDTIPASSFYHIMTGYAALDGFLLQPAARQRIPAFPLIHRPEKG